MRSSPPTRTVRSACGGWWPGLVEVAPPPADAPHLHRPAASLRNYVIVRRHRKRLWIEHCDAVWGLAVSRLEGLMYSVLWDQSLEKLNTMDCTRCLESMKAHEDAINAIVAWYPVYTGSADVLIEYG
ncbi:hypothetical protein CDL15_Pgr014852 [Punica granatum]|uniref:Uncharacterized protein n=1 Tax=Punica granatum TaxID=22663 RepID=A0A218Y161_PUNGR|nr:hypothetical protein CDL15_Pgr014852 [Punica granatum]PKI65354.1 hypothetical protein CRG98_014236 [Punica granatum]